MNGRAVANKVLEYIGWRSSPGSVPLFSNTPRAAVALVLIVILSAIVWKVM